VSAQWRAEPERGSGAALRLIAWLALKFGRAGTRWLLPPICLYFYAFAPRSRQASRVFLARALGRAPRMLEVMRHHYAFASTLHDRVFLLSGRAAPLDIAVKGEAEVERLLGLGRGCLLVGSHLGSFEILRALGRLRGKPVSVLMHEENAAKASRAFSRLAPEVQQRVIAAGRPGTMLRVKECLERGEVVGILADRPLARERTSPRSFLGEAALFPVGPWQLAATLGVPVVLFFGLYLGGARYEVRFEVLSEGGPLARERRGGAAERWLDCFVGRLEHHARRAPYNWFNFYDFWAAGAS
jgi:predicted LPLAT superfamily acyltransferase